MASSGVLPPAAGASDTASTPGSTHTIYVTLQPKIPVASTADHPFHHFNLSHKYRSVGVCSGLRSDTADHRLSTMHMLFHAVRNRYDSQFWPGGPAPASESESEGSLGQQSQAQSFETVFNSCKTVWEKNYGETWKTAKSYTDEQRPDGLEMLSDTQLVLLTENEFNQRFPSKPGQWVVAVHDYQSAQPGEVVMNFAWSS